MPAGGVGTVQGSEGLVVGVPRARIPPVEAGGHPAANRDSNRLLKTAAPSSPRLGKAGAGSQWSSREETDGVGGHRSARGGELLRRIHAVTLSPKPAAPALRRPSSASPARGLRSSTMTENMEMKKCPPYQRLSIDCELITWKER